MQTSITRPAGPAYLLSQGNPPVRAEDVRKAIGLITETVDPTLNAGIALLSGLGNCRRQTWMIPVSGFGYCAMRRYGRPVALGDICDWHGEPYRSFTVEPEESDVRRLLRLAVNWAVNQPDIQDALAAEERVRSQLRQAVAEVLEVA